MVKEVTEIQRAATGDRLHVENSVPFNMALLTFQKSATSHISSANAIVINFLGLPEQTGGSQVQQEQFGMRFMVPYAGILIFHHDWTSQGSKPFSVLLFFHSQIIHITAQCELSRKTLFVVLLMGLFTMLANTQYLLSCKLQDHYCCFMIILKHTSLACMFQGYVTLRE